ncbi:hypothetical protein ACS0TY_008562 [Phlomoides rotata]
MAVGSGSASGKNGRVKSLLPLQKKEMNSQENALHSLPLKRNKSPGIRVVRGRIYDPVNGKTCHQFVENDFLCISLQAYWFAFVLTIQLYILKCRQKTRDFVAACKRKRETINDQPTGILITTAKATGYSSVSEMLLKGGETSNQEKVEPVIVASPKKDDAASPKTQGEENSTLKRRTSPSKLSVCHKITNEEAHMIKEDEANASTDEIVNQQIADLYAEIPLPMGTELKSVSKIDLHTDDVGSALQFFEFCAVFHKANSRSEKGTGGICSSRLTARANWSRAKYSATAQFHILLLSILQKEQRAEPEVLSPSNGKSSWFHALKKYFSESQSALKVQYLDSLEEASDYETLKASEKLGLINVLCDELRKLKKKGSAAKKTKKSLKQKMRDDLANAIITKHGEPLSFSEHEAIVSQIKHETEEAHAKLLESKAMVLENKKRSCDALRIEPAYVGRGGNVYWKLKCSGNSDVLRQNVGEGDALTLNEKWFGIDDEGKQAIEHICSSK